MSTGPTAAFVEKLAQAWPPAQWQEVRVVVAVSGGADSVALLHGLATLRAITKITTGGLWVAHFNHGLRGEESSADAHFVKQLAEAWQLPFCLGEAAVGRLKTTGQDGIEAAARTARYNFLQQTAAELGARFVATAHTRDDQVETILHRLLRGTGLAGLVGIPRVRRLSEMATLLRPLLGFSRSEIEGYLTAVGQSYRTDATNAELIFTRNKIRHALLPHLRSEFNPRVDEALLRLAGQAEETLTAVDQLLEPLCEQVKLAVSPQEVRWRRVPLQSAPPAIVRHLLLRLWQEQQWPLQEMSAERWAELAAAIASGTRLDLPGGLSLHCISDQVVFTQHSLSS